MQARLSEALERRQRATRSKLSRSRSRDEATAIVKRLYRLSVEADMLQMQVRSHQKPTKIPPGQKASGVDALVRQ
uniref:Uncharacterized protein n=1 Tax=Parascaris equorum TaxID=6256 RepID=A0A914S8C7_PAREQ